MDVQSSLLRLVLAFPFLVSMLLTILSAQNVARLNDMCHQLQLVPELEFDLILLRFNFSS